MGSGFSKMKKQMKQMEAQVQLMQESLKSKKITGQSGNGLVTVTISGDKELKEIIIKPECVDKDDVEGLQDLILAAFQEAFRQAEESSSSPAGFSLPF